MFRLEKIDFSLLIVVSLISCLAIFLLIPSGLYNSNEVKSRYLDRIDPNKISFAISYVDDSIISLTSAKKETYSDISYSKYLKNKRDNIVLTRTEINASIDLFESTLPQRSKLEIFFNTAKEPYEEPIEELKAIVKNLNEIEKHITNLESFSEFNPDKTDQINESISLTNKAIDNNFDKLNRVSQSLKEIDVKKSSENKLDSSSSNLKKQLTQE